MIKVLWLCNRPLEKIPDRRDGTWFTAMANVLVETEGIKLSIIGQAKVKSMIQRDFDRIKQWVVPYEKLNRYGLPSRRTLESIRQVVDMNKPDLIHIWGTENYWGLLTARGMLAVPSVLEIQGIKYVWARSYYGGLSINERIGCIGPLEIVRPGSFMFFGKRRFERWGKFEKEMILKHDYISTQSNWVRAHLIALKPRCSLFKTGMMLRKEFFEAQPWNPRRDRDSIAPSIFTSSSGAPPYKGLHVLMRAVASLKRKYPRIVFNVGGDIMKKGIKRSGYARWLLDEARRLTIGDDIRWLGPLDANGIIREFHKASIVAIPSFVESYSLVLAEAMVVGVPAVVSYAGAMPELARDGESALFFPPGDELACAWQIDKILSDETLAERISINARETGLSRNDPHTVVERQIEIYNEILGRKIRC